MKYKLLSKLAKPPRKSNPDDIGWDVFPTRWEIKNGYLIIHTDLAVQPPEGYYFDLVPRSSQCKIPWVFCNSFGVIDPPYIGGMQVRMRPAMSVELIREEHGIVKIKCDTIASFELDLDKAIAQLVLRKIEDKDRKFEQVDNFEQTTRGDKGFGSTNV